MNEPSSVSQENSEPLVFPRSEDFGDVSLYMFLQWHISVCVWCHSQLDITPPQFGVYDKRHCPDYYEIIQEYSDYERDYISRGNP